MKFNKKELQRLNCNDEEISLIMEYQKKLPILSENEDINSLCVNAKDLWTQLNNGADVSTKFQHWAKKNIVEQNYTSSEYEEFYENSDGVFKNTVESKAQLSRMGVTKNYMLSVNMAKDIAMYTGAMPRANDILKHNSKMVRKYFLLMESIVKRNKDWLDTRAPQKKNYKPMCEAISRDVFYKTGVYGDKYNFSREANIMNRIATGCNAQAIKLYLGAEPNDITRDYLTKEYNERIAFLQEQNILLASMHLSTVDRVKTLIQFFNIKFPDATPIQNYKDRDFLLSQQHEIISELENI